MLTLADAKALAKDFVARQWEPLAPPDEWVLAEERTVERPWGWVFIVTSRLWRMTGEARYAVAGNAPVAVEASTSKVVALGTAKPLEVYIREYDAARTASAEGHEG